IISMLLLSILNGCNNIPKNQMEYGSPTGEQINEQRDETNSNEDSIIQISEKEKEVRSQDVIEDKKP
ncbi:MAG: hypothetical protein ACRC6Z_03525, partial [Cetobacterium sp.]